MDLKLGQRLTVRVEKLSLGGDGIARIKDHRDASKSFVIFIPYSLPNEHLEIQIIETRKNFARGQITKVLESNSQRIGPPCPYFFNSRSAIQRNWIPAPRSGSRTSFAGMTTKGKPIAVLEFNSSLITQNSQLPSWCGGCNFQHLTYPYQLEMKFLTFKETLEKIAKVSSHCVLHPLGMPPSSEWGYRNKIQVPFGKSRDGHVVAGFYAPGSHQIIPIKNCLIQSKQMMEFINFVREKMEEWQISPYCEKTHRGWLRHLFLRENQLSKEMLSIFITAKDFFPRQHEWVTEIRKTFPNVIGILQNTNYEKTNVILGKQWKKIYGQDFLVERLQGLGQNGSDLQLKVSASSFFQINTIMAGELYKTVRDFALSDRFDKHKSLLDLYCGVGGIGLVCAPDFEKVVSVDETPSSIRDAKFNAELNKIKNCEFHCSDVRFFLRDFHLITHNSQHTTVVLDPPRSGCLEEVLRQIVKIRPEKIVYVSCEPSTLARDLNFLTVNGYTVKKIQLVDLFPQSSHIESVTLLKR